MPGAAQSDLQELWNERIRLIAQADDRLHANQAKAEAARAALMERVGEIEAAMAGMRIQGAADLEIAARLLSAIVEAMTAPHTGHPAVRLARTVLQGLRRQQSPHRRPAA